MEAAAPSLVSVASCGAESAPTASPVRSPASLVFSLQFYVDRVSLDAVEASLSPDKDSLLGFQLLQYEIVVFDAAVAASSCLSEPTVTTLRHGKSCLFEADPDELRLELQRDVDAPLTLLLLTREHGRARLRAFAAVPLELHVGLDDDDVLSRRSLLRVCEWASHSGSWELRDHRNAAVGRVTGVVTLSCLGKTLAPHLTEALGVQVSKSQLSSPREEELPTEEEEEKQQPPSAESEVKLQEEEKVETQELGVQCDEDMIVQDTAEPMPAPMSLRSGTSGAVQLDSAVKTKSASVEGQLLYYKSSAKGATNPRRIRSRPRRDSNSPPIAAAVTKGELLFPRELPPPLFFQKARRAKS
ncbi:hypothetical protein PR003_g1895 [Phytophthora rubi]|uniref:Uncharacterized protein n=1 Tax=Phytophthora rubi TaxID=129364 RepID=A0A6A3P0U2_9STRA|nr:hypothetical protein PR002_g1757 [Phytophthora rubi]KAE9051189.1 hypothetical protein PR001_g1675 [Phytophthora rubi]KAE9357250.1 hypothetical protein PR003_g1895 [Phytophthora rubi]